MLHWVSAARIVMMIPTGLIMARALDDGLRLSLYQAHLLAGWVIVALMVARVVLRFRWPVLAPHGLAPWNRALFRGVHWAVTLFPRDPPLRSPARLAHRTGRCPTMELVRMSIRRRVPRPTKLEGGS